MSYDGYDQEDTDSLRVWLYIIGILTFLNCIFIGVIAIKLSELGVIK